MIPLVNLKRQYASIKDEIDAAIRAVVEAQAFIKGPTLKAFEDAWRREVGASYGAGCANGTAAVSLALEALGVGPGDEVVLPSHTFFATAEAVLHVGARPRFVDIEPGGHTLDFSQVEIGPQVRAIIPVHIHGLVCDMDAAAALAERHDLLVVEDAAQAHLARWRGRCAGALGDAGCFSFFPGKNLGAFGDAGFVTLRDPAAAARLEKLIDHGRLSKYLHDMVGYNQRMDALQAAVLSAKLPHLAAWTERRRAAARLYDERLRPRGFKTLEPLSGCEPAYHHYTVEVADRDGVIDALRRAGVDAGAHYPVPLHLQPALADLGWKQGSLPVTERVTARIVSLPICGSITDDEIMQVCDAFLAIARPD